MARFVLTISAGEKTGLGARSFRPRQPSHPLAMSPEIRVLGLAGELCSLRLPAESKLPETGWGCRQDALNRCI